VANVVIGAPDQRDSLDDRGRVRAVVAGPSSNKCTANRAARSGSGRTWSRRAMRAGLLAMTFCLQNATARRLAARDLTTTVLTLTLTGLHPTASSPGQRTEPFHRLGSVFAMLVGARDRGPSAARHSRRHRYSRTGERLISPVEDISRRLDIDGVPGPERLAGLDVEDQGRGALEQGEQAEHGGQ
jgi:hypothetical protein